MKKSIKLSNSKYQIRYSEEFKRNVCNEYISGQGSKAELARKHSIGGGSYGITRWLRSFGYEDMPPSSVKEKTEEELENKIKQLKRQLEDKELQSEMYSKMIDIAEEELGIDIRKKSNTK